jgi:ABC-2 type transport system permease protein
MSGFGVVTAREWKSYFSTPLAYVFLVVFLVLCGFSTFELGGFYQRNQADLSVFFSYQPWLYLFLGAGHLHALVGGRAQKRFD